MAAETRHSFEGHTSEVRLCVWGPTFEAVFEEAGRGLAALMLEGTPGEPAAEQQHVEVHGRDRAALLVAWLNELIYLSEAHKQVYTDLHIDELTETSLRGSVRGVEPEALRTAVKAATLYDVVVGEAEDGCSARVVLDV